MISTDYLTVTNSGGGVTVGEVRKSYPGLGYLKPGAYVAKFEGLETALDFISTLKAGGPNNKNGHSSQDEGGNDFNKFVSFAEAMDMFRNKSQELVHFDEGEMRIKDNNEAGSLVDYDVTGDYIDMGRFMEGVPESVGTMHMGSARSRRLNVTFGVNARWDINEAVIHHRGERIVRLVDALESGGVRVRLTGVSSTECEHIETTVKQFGEGLQLADLAVVTHPEWLRRMMFMLKEQSKTFSYGYGSSLAFDTHITPRMLEEDQLNDETGLYIGTNFTTKETIDQQFDKLERLLQWEMSKPIPEVSSIKLDSKGIQFESNGARSETEVAEEGRAVIDNE